MGLSYKVNAEPTVIREGEFAVYQGKVYVGGPNNDAIRTGLTLEEIVKGIDAAALAQRISQVEGVLLTQDQLNIDSLHQAIAEHQELFQKFDLETNPPQEGDSLTYSEGKFIPQATVSEDLKYDEGYVRDSFAFIVEVDSESLDYPLPVYNHVNIQTADPTAVNDFVIDWGDGTVERSIDAFDSVTHTYQAAGQYLIRVYGDILCIRNPSSPDRSKLKKIVNWGPTKWRIFSFRKNFDLIVQAYDVPDLSLVSNNRIENAFSDCRNRLSQSNFAGWDLANITSIEGIFSHSNPGPSINTWDTSQIENFRIAFQFSDFNYPLTWDFSAATNLNLLFADSAFNQPLPPMVFNTGASIDGMFMGNSQFNQDITSWDINPVGSNIANFGNGSALDQDFSGWDFTGITVGSNIYTLFENLSPANYDALLISMASQTVNANITVDFGSSQYTSAASAARDTLINTHGWTITDGGLVV